MGKLFGTDGIRGIANKEPVTPELALRLGKAVVNRCQQMGIPQEIIIGRDTRISGEMLEFGLISGILSAGGTSLRAGIIPTPGVAYLTRKHRAGSGLVISASHNPYEHNGFKVFSGSGTKLNEEEEQHLEQAIISGTKVYNETTLTQPGTNLVLSTAIDEYADFLLDSLEEPEALKGLKIVIDCANGATYQVAPLVFDQLGVEFTGLFTDPDGKNINLNCGSQHPHALTKSVIASGADAGLAFDGDGDRLIAVDEKGEVVSGDQLLTIFARMLKETGRLKANTVVSTVMSNIGFRIAMESMNISHITANVGDRNVFQEMKNCGAVLGGEESGHIIFLDHHTTGDGLLSALQLLAALTYFDMPLSQLANFMTVFPQVLINVPVSRKPPIDSVPPITEIIRRVENELKSKGRVLVRYSGTESLCRVMVEGEDLDHVKLLAQRIAEVIQKELE